MRGACVLLLLALCVAPAAGAAAPVLEYLYPDGGQRGSSVTVTAGGKFDPWPVSVWTDSPELKFEPAAANGSFTVRVGPGVAPGPHLVRLYNGEGASALRIFMVGEHAEVAETEPNDDVTSGQRLGAVPVTVNGQLEKAGDVDAFAVQIEAGRCLVASLQGRRLGAPMDPMLHLFDEAGNQIAFAHDGFGLDPVLVYRAAATGRFVVRVSGFAHPPAAEVRLTGGKSDVYRLNLTTGPVTRWCVPAAVQRGTRRKLVLSGWNLAVDGRATVWDADATSVGAAQGWLPLPFGSVDGALRVGVNDGAEFVESEVEPASAPAVPFGVTGRITSAREEDRYHFAAKKGEKLTLIVRGGWVVSAFDPVLRVEDSSGKQLARDDDGGGGGPGSGGAGSARLEFSASDDGTFHAVVGDLNRGGGEDYDYHLSVARPVPHVTATVAAHELRVLPGKSVSIKGTVRRVHGHAAELVIVATGLPAGVMSGSATVPVTGGEVEVILSAAADAKPASGPIRVMVLGTDPLHPFARAAEYDLAKEAGQAFIESIESVWLTVLPPPPPAPATQPAKPAGTPLGK